MRRMAVFGVFVCVFVAMMGLAFAQQQPGKTPKEPEGSGRGHMGGMMQQMAAMIRSWPHVP